mmetsp:Transcript_108606/g.307009  ORF Transcript_108606/g.307009 Transcript_108606/m.307009 type:complete len:299 (-) Transcript_108606:179-1075(-)
MSHSGSVNCLPSALQAATILATSAVQSSRHAFWPAMELTKGGEIMKAFAFSTSSPFLLSNELMTPRCTFDRGTFPSSKTAHASSAGRFSRSSSLTTLSTASFTCLGSMASSGGSSSPFSSFSLAVFAAWAISFSASMSSTSTLSSSRNSRSGKPSSGVPRPSFTASSVMLSKSSFASALSTSSSRIMKIHSFRVMRLLRSRSTSSRSAISNSSSSSSSISTSDSSSSGGLSWVALQVVSPCAPSLTTLGASPSPFSQAANSSNFMRSFEDAPVSCIRILNLSAVMPGSTDSSSKASSS